MQDIDDESKEKIKNAKNVDELNRIYEHIRAQQEIETEQNESKPFEGIIKQIEDNIEWPVLDTYTLPEKSLSWLTLKGPVFSIDDQVITYSDYFDAFVNLNDYL